MIRLRTILLTLLSVAVLSVAARAAITPPTGYIYGPLELGSLTQSCVAPGPGGTFVGVGPGFTANAQAIVLAKESGDTRLIAIGFNSISDCAYDAVNDVLYVTDNADSGELPAALTGDTVFAIPSASVASALSAPALALLPANSVPSAAGLAVDSGGDVFVSNSAGGGTGMVFKIDVSAPALTPFASAFDFTAGLALDPASGDLFAADTLGTFDARIRHFTAAGVEQPLFAGPSFGFGSYDLAFNSDSRLLATGLFGGDVVAFSVSGTPSPFVSGLNFATGISVDGFTGRVEILSSFTATAEDRSLHRFTPVSALVEGGGSSETDCLQEFYGLALVGADAVCVDGAACDADGTVNDRCLFPVGFCFNVNDPDLTGCTAGGSVTEVSLSTKPSSTATTDVQSRIANALPISGPACVFGDGVTVPVQITGAGAKKDGKGKVKVKVTASDERKDSDTVKLVCQPAL